MNNVTETRYDLDTADFAKLDLVSMQALITLTTRWQHRNHVLRTERLAREAQGPQVLA